MFIGENLVLHTIEQDAMVLLHLRRARQSLPGVVNDLESEVGENSYEWDEKESNCIWSHSL